MPNRRRRKQQHLATQAIELAWAVPEVLATRIVLMSLAGHSPSLRDWREFYLMGAEKIAAFYESWNAMLVEGVRANLRLAPSSVYLWWAPWTGPRQLPRLALMRMRATTLAIAGSGLAPIRRRAVANAKRLRRKRVL